MCLACVHAQLRPTLRNPIACSLPGSSVRGIFQAKTLELSCHFLLQGIFLTQGSNPHLLSLLNWQVDSLLLCHPGKSYVTYLKRN